MPPKSELSPRGKVREGTKVLKLTSTAKRPRYTRRYIRRLVGLVFLSPELVDAI
jgi:hypothetical protein